MRTVLSFHWLCQCDWKPVSEDVRFTSNDQCLFVVADGVTRRGFTGSYPDPSPAQLAADAAVEAIGKTLAEDIGKATRVTTRHVVRAFRNANTCVREVNRNLEFWDNHDWWGRDLAGTVASCLVLQEATFLFGFMADCGVARVSATGDLLWRTPDLLAPAEKFFPSADALGQRERFVRIHRDFRNKPQASHPTYGVLTGEEDALSYIQVGSRPYNAGEVLAVYSDGAAPFVMDDPAFRQLLLHGSQSHISDYVAQRSSATQHPDEKTLIVVRT